MRLRSAAIALGFCLGLGGSSRHLVGQAAAAASPGASATPSSSSSSSGKTGDVFAWKEGWTEVPQWGGRLAYVDARGDLRARLRSDPDGPWVVVASGVASFQLLDWSLAVLDREGTLLTAEGALDAPLTPVAQNVCAYQKTLTRLGILQCDGTLLVQETPRVPARPVAAGVEAFQLLEDRAAFRAADGSLWLQEGGVVRNFRRIADRVTSFQLERGWIGFLQNGALMLAESPLESGAALRPREVARDVADFEMEIRVDGGDFRKTLRLAVVTRDGVLKIASARGSPVELKEFDRGSICGLAWAGGRLAYLGPEGLKIADFGEGDWPERLDSFDGAISFFRVVREGAVVLDRDGRSRLFDWRQVPEAEGVSAESAGLAESRAAVRILAASDELEDPSASAVESSSMRPAFLRRPVRAPGATSTTITPVRQFSDVPEARPVPSASLEAPESGEEPAPEPPMPVSSAPSLEPEAAQATLQNGVPLYELNSPGYTDHFYTTNASERDYAKTLGYQDLGIAAYVEPTHVAGTNPFWRFFSGSRSDHFYTTSASEYNYVVSIGYVYESVEGYLYASQAAGTVPLYRLSLWNPANGDLDHFYTISDSARSSKMSSGWTYDGVAGYVWPAAAPPPVQGPPLYRWYSSTWTDHFLSVVNYGVISGFAQQGIAAYMAPGPGPSAVRFRRFWKGSPTAEHFYTTNAAEATYVVNTLGYVEEGTGEGYLFITPQPNTVPFYRLYWCNPAGTGDCDHIYTAWASEKDQLVANGWYYEGVIGYVGMPPGSPPPIPVPPPVDNAAFASQSVPGLMTAGRASSVSIAMKNTGNTTWTSVAGYQLASWNKQDNVTWGVSRVSLPYNVPPGGTVTFSFSVTPAAAGRQTFQWRMVRLGGAFGGASQNVSVVVDKNPYLIGGGTPWADNYIRYFDSLGGWVPAQTSDRRKPYRGIECATPYMTTSACNPGVPAWARDNRNIDPINPCVTPILVTEIFSANHARRNIGPDVHGVTWTPVGKNTYGPINWSPCDILVYQLTGFCHAPTNLLFWLVQADPLLSVGSGTYCPTDQKSTTRYSKGAGTREILPGEVTPDSYAMVPNWAPDFAQLGVQPNPWRAYVPSGHKVTTEAVAAKGDVFWINVPNVGNSIPVLGATLFGGGTGPQCMSPYYYCESITDRAMAQLTDNGWAITITGYMTGNDNIVLNTNDALADLRALNGSGESNPHVDAIQNWLIAHNVLNPIFFGHSLGAMDAALLYQRGFGSQMVLFSAPAPLPYTSLLPAPSELVAGNRPVIVYGGLNDTISNLPPILSGCFTNSNTCRIGNGVNLFQIDTGSGFWTFSNPHDRCQYQPFYFGPGQCPF